MKGVCNDSFAERGSDRSDHARNWFVPIRIVDRGLVLLQVHVQKV